MKKHNKKKWIVNNLGNSEISICKEGAFGIDSYGWDSFDEKIIIAEAADDENDCFKGKTLKRLLERANNIATALNNYE